MHRHTCRAAQLPHTEILTPVNEYSEKAAVCWEGTAWHVERAPLLDLLAPLHAVSDGVTVQHSHIHTNPERAAQGHSPLLPIGGFFAPPLSWIDYLSPPVSLLGGGPHHSDKQMKHRQQGTVRSMKDTDIVWEKGRQSDMPVGKVIFCMTHSNNLHASYLSFKLSIWRQCIYIFVTLI